MRNKQRWLPWGITVLYYLLIAAFAVGAVVWAVHTGNVDSSNGVIATLVLGTIGFFAPFVVVRVARFRSPAFAAAIGSKINAAPSLVVIIVVALGWLSFVE